MLCRGHEFIGRVLQGFRRTRQLREQVDRELIRKTVTAKKDAVAGHGDDRRHVNLERTLNTECARQLVTSRMRYRLFRGEATHPDPLLGNAVILTCLLYTSPSPRDRTRSRM